MAVCPSCGVELSQHSVKGVELRVCQACEGVVLARGDLLRLRGVDRSLHPALRAASDPAGQAGHPRRSCPGCGADMSAYDYRGGRTRVDRCAACDLLFLDRGELPRILDEWEQGLEMSGEARALLDGHREQQLWQRYVSADSAVGTVGLASVVLFFYLAFGDYEYGHRGWVLPLPLALAIAAGYFLVSRWRARKEQRTASRALKRHYDRKDREGAGSGPERPTPPTPSGKQARHCPWCNAPLMPGATHCAACDSDIF